MIQLIMFILGMLVGYVLIRLIKMMICSKWFLFWLDPKSADFFINDVFKNLKQWGVEKYKDNKGFVTSTGYEGITFDFDLVHEDGWLRTIIDNEDFYYKTSYLFKYGIILYFEDKVYDQTQEKTIWDKYEEVKQKRLTQMLNELDENEYDSIIETVNQRRIKKTKHHEY